MARGKELLDDSPSKAFVGPFSDTDVGVKQVRPRFLVPLPHHHTKLFLGRVIIPRVGFLDLTTALVATGDDKDYKELINWLLTAITRETTGSVPVLAQPTFAAPAADKVLIRHQRQILVKHLPRLDASKVPLLATLKATQQRWWTPWTSWLMNIGQHGTIQIHEPEQVRHPPQ